MKRIRLTASVLLVALAPFVSSAQDPDGREHLDKILEKRSFTPAETNALNKDSNPSIDVRDLVIFLNGQPVSASFASAETLAFQSQGSVTLTVNFSKPVTGTIRYDLGGNAVAGAGQDYVITPATSAVSNAVSTQITVTFQPWRGMGGEKIVRLTLNRNPNVIPRNGEFPTHLIRVRQFNSGEFIGILSFPAGSGLPSLPVRVGLHSGGAAVCSFQGDSTILGKEIALTWSVGSQGFPAFGNAAQIEIPGADLNRSTPLRATLALQRLSAPFSNEWNAYMEGFPQDNLPALYAATFTFHDLFGVGARFSEASNPYAVVHHGNLVLQPVEYLNNQQ